MVALREWTRSWWSEERNHYQLVTSDAVLDELENEDHPFRMEKIELLNGVALLEIPEAIAEIVQIYLSHRLMPRMPLATRFIWRSHLSTSVITFSHGIASISQTPTSSGTSGGLTKSCVFTPRNL